MSGNQGDADTEVGLPVSVWGFRLLAHSAGKYFVTPTHGDGKPWDPAVSAVFVLPDDDTIRIELLRGTAYQEESRESTLAGAQRPPFTC